MNIKKTTILIIAIFIGIANQSFTQGHITSPYSFIGLGDNFQKGNIKSLSMGGVDMALRSNLYINMMNPAGISGIDSMSFVGSVGVAMDNSSYRTSDLTSEFSSAHINHLAIAFPISKWWKTSVLLLPYSSLGYEVLDQSVLEENWNIDYTYQGEGGVDAVTLTNAFNVTDNLALGLSASYYFGKLEHTRTVTFPDSTFIFNTMVREKVLLNGLVFKAGLQYFLPLDDKNTIGFGLTYGNKSSLNATTDYLAFDYLGSELYNNSTLDTVRKWSDEPSTIEMPFNLGAGISWVKKNKMSIAADFSFENWENFKYKNSNLNLSNKLRAAIGGEYIPESNTLSKYWKMVHYRMGFRYEHLGMKFADTELKEYAISVGFGLPLRKSNTFVNLGFEIGQNGTVDNNLIQERFFKVMLGVTIKERWFRQSKYY